MFVFSDTPFIMPNLVLECFEKLDEQDIIIGSDGGEGYYLVGMSQPYDYRLLGKQAARVG